MTTLRVRWVGDQAVLSRAELERLIELARRTEEVELQGETDDVPASGLAWLAAHGGAFDWLVSEEDLYTVDDLKVRYR